MIAPWRVRVTTRWQYTANIDERKTDRVIHSRLLLLMTLAERATMFY